MTDSSDIASIYEQVLGRSPDHSGMVSYTAMLDGGADVSTIQSLVAHSPEAQTDLEQIYERVLGREADPSGLATYLGELSNGVSLAQVRAMIAASPEAQNRLEQIYNEVLGRDADPGGLATYRDALANGSSLAQVRAIIASSGEVAGDMEQVYRNVLGRDADPGGLATYQSALSNGWTLSGVRSNMATSAEAQADVTSLFKQVLNRDPSPAELAPAEAQLAQGASLNDLQLQLTGSGTLVTSQATLPQTDPVVTGPTTLPLTDPLPTDPVITPSQFGDLVGVRLQTPGGSSEPSGYVTFGQVFMPGAVKPTDSLVARINGVNYAVQMDVKSTNADGSVRQAILTLDAPAIAAGGSLDLMLAKGTASAPSPTAPTASGLLSSGYNVGVNFTFHNPDGTTTTDSASASAALQAALNAGTVKTWLSGPGVNEYDVVTTVDGGKLKVEFDIRAYANGTTTTDVIFDNSWMFSPGKTDLNYDVSISQGGQQTYTASAVQQYLYSMWDHQVASAGTISPNIQYDLPYLINTGAVPAYDTSFGVSDAAIQYNYNGLNATNTGPMGTGTVGTYMPGTGGRQDIGPQPNWTAQWLLSQNATAYLVMMADASASGSIPWHYTDESTGKPVNEQTYPNFTIGEGFYGFLQPANGWPQYSNTGSPIANGDSWAPDPAHMPDLNYLPYLTTGSHYQLELLQAEAAYAISSVLNEGTALDTSGTVQLGIADSFSGNGNINSSNGNQTRGIAWELRSIAEAAYLTPDTDPLKAYFTNELNIAMKGLVQEYIVDNVNGQYGQLNGFIEGSSGPDMHAITPFEQDYLVTSLAEVAAMNIPGASTEAVQMMNFMNNFVAGVFTNGPNGYNPLDGTSYWIGVNDYNTGAPYTTWSQLFNVNASSGWVQGMSGIPTNPTELINWPTQTMGGYGAIAKAAVADEITYTQSPQAIQAYGFVVSQIAYAFSLNGSDFSSGSGGTLSAAYQNYPQWSIMPRLPDGAWLPNSQMQIDTSGAASVTLNATGGDSLLAVVGSGTATLNGGSGSSDLMFGGTGTTTFNPGPGNDYLFAAYNATGTQTFNDNIGNNYMYGSSAGHNIYVFAESSSGHDTIANFNVTTDQVRIGANLNGNGITSAQQLIAGATLSNGNTVLHLSSKDDITLLGVNQPSSLLNSILVA